MLMLLPRPLSPKFPDRMFPWPTAADIQSALEPITGPMLSCQIVASQPSVVAEFANAHVAPTAAESEIS
jgi:hypothetical protein